MASDQLPETPIFVPRGVLVVEQATERMLSRWSLAVRDVGARLLGLADRIAGNFLGQRVTTAGFSQAPWVFAAAWYADEEGNADLARSGSAGSALTRPGVALLSAAAMGQSASVGRPAPVAQEQTADAQALTRPALQAAPQPGSTRARVPDTAEHTAKAVATGDRGESDAGTMTPRASAQTPAGAVSPPPRRTMAGSVATNIHRSADAPAPLTSPTTEVGSTAPPIPGVPISDGQPTLAERGAAIERVVVARAPAPERERVSRADDAGPVGPQADVAATHGSTGSAPGSVVSPMEAPGSLAAASTRIASAPATATNAVLSDEGQTSVASPAIPMMGAVSGRPGIALSPPPGNVPGAASETAPSEAKAEAPGIVVSEAKAEAPGIVVSEAKAGELVRAGSANTQLRRRSRLPAALQPILEGRLEFAAPPSLLRSYQHLAWTDARLMPRGASPATPGIAPGPWVLLFPDDLVASAPATTMLGLRSRATTAVVNPLASATGGQRAVGPDMRQPEGRGISGIPGVLSSLVAPTMLAADSQTGEGQPASGPLRRAPSPPPVADAPELLRASVAQDAMPPVESAPTTAPRPLPVAAAGTAVGVAVVTAGADPSAEGVGRREPAGVDVLVPAVRAQQAVRSHAGDAGTSGAAVFDGHARHEAVYPAVVVEGAPAAGRRGTDNLATGLIHVSEPFSSALPAIQLAQALGGMAHGRISAQLAPFVARLLGVRLLEQTQALPLEASLVAAATALRELVQADLVHPHAGSREQRGRPAVPTAPQRAAHAMAAGVIEPRIPAREPSGVALDGARVAASPVGSMRRQMAVWVAPSPPTSDGGGTTAAIGAPLSDSSAGASPGQVGRLAEQLAGLVGARAAGLSVEFLDPGQPLASGFVGWPAPVLSVGPFADDVSSSPAAAVLGAAAPAHPAEPSAMAELVLPQLAGPEGAPSFVARSRHGADRATTAGPIGRAPRGSYTWSRAAEFVAHLPGWAVPPTVYAATLGAAAAATGQPAWSAMPELVVPELPSATVESPGNAGELRTGLNPFTLRRKQSLGQAGSDDRPGLQLLEVGSRYDSGDSQRRSEWPAFAPPELALVRPPPAPAAPTSDASAHLVGAMQRQAAALPSSGRAAGGGGAERLTVGDLTLVAVAAAQQRVAASTSPALSSGSSGAGGTRQSSGTSARASGMTIEQEQREIDELARRVLSEVELLMTIGRERSGD